MAEGAVEKGIGSIDKVFGKLAGWITKQISGFVSFLFFLFAAGALYGYFIVPHAGQFAIWLLLAPFILGLIAYYSRTFATILFFLLIVLFIL